MSYPGMVKLGELFCPPDSNIPCSVYKFDDEVFENGPAIFIPKEQLGSPSRWVAVHEDFNVAMNAGQRFGLMQRPSGYGLRNSGGVKSKGMWTVEYRLESLD